MQPRRRFLTGLATFAVTAASVLAMVAAPADLRAEDGTPPAAESDSPTRSRAKPPVIAGSDGVLVKRRWPNLRDEEAIDLDRDGAIDAMRLRGYWTSRRGDEVTVYADGGNFPNTGDSRTALNFDKSTWVFDARSEGRASLIVRFAQEDGKAVAYIWDDQDDDGAVSYVVQQRDVVITESPFWTVKVWADGDWFRPDGSLNANLHALQEGCGSCMTAGARFPRAVENAMAIDGAPDLAFDLIDEDDDGIPEYSIRRIITPISDTTYSLPFLLVQANEGKVPPAPPRRALFWPLLVDSVLPVTEGAANYFDVFPYVPVDLNKADALLPELVGYPIEDGFHINSAMRVRTDDGPIYANFENPMAYYDLAADDDGAPEMHIRFEYAGADDPHLLRGQSDVPMMDVRYSWNQANGDGLVWDHKIGLSGRYEIDETVTLGDLELLSVPWSEVPGWVTGRTWDMATFVVVEPPERYVSSEGIYAWPINVTATRPYFGGLSPAGPTFTEIRAGLRGEFRESSGPVRLYLDEIDGRMHLVGASGGTWNLGDDGEIRLVDRGDGGVIDGWQHWRFGLLVAQLYRVPGGMVYAGPDGTWFRSAALRAEPETFSPPGNHEEWVEVGRRLDAAGSLPPPDLRAMFDRFSGDPQRLSARPLSNWAWTADGARFALDGADAATADALAALTRSDLEVGSLPVVVSRTAFGWSAASGILRLPTVLIESEPSRASVLTPIHVEVEDSGTIGVGPAVLDVLAVAPDGAETFVASRDIAFDENGRFTATTAWAPLDPGIWTLKAEVRRVSPSRWGVEPVVIGAGTHRVDVAVAGALSPRSASLLGWEGGRVPQVFVLGGFALLASVAAGLALRPGAGTT